MESQFKTFLTRNLVALICATQENKMHSSQLHVPSRGQVTPILFSLMLEPNFQRGPETWKWLSSMWIRTSCWKAYPTQAFEAPKWAMLAGTREYCNSATITTFTLLAVHTWVFLLFILPISLSFPKYCKRSSLYMQINL